MDCNHDECKTPYCPSCGVKIPTLTKDQKLATKLHEMFCHSNHTDGCSWCYEKVWEKHTTKYKYLKLATEIHRIYTGSDITVFMSMHKLIKEHAL